MNRVNVYLSVSIAIALSAEAFPQEEPPSGDELEPITVVGTPIDPIPVPAGPNPAHNRNYWWRPTDQPGGGGGEGTVTPEIPSPPSISPYCAMMALQGFPDGCSRQYLQAGPPQISQISNPWQLDHLGGYAFNGSLLNTFFDYSAVALRNCYSDISNDPLSCESNYSNTIRNICSIHARPVYSARNDMTDQELCQLGANEIEERMATIASTRNPGFWYRYFEDNQLGVIRAFYVAVDWITPFIPLDQYNELLVEARRYANCKIIVDVWDEQGCGITLPS